MDLSSLNHVGLRLRYLRLHVEHKKVPQHIFAEWMCVKLRVYQSYESGKAKPGSDKIANLLLTSQKKFPAITIDSTWLLTGIGQPYLMNENEKMDMYSIGPTVLIQDSRIVNASTSLEQLTGYTATELTECECISFLALDSRVIVESSVEDLTEKPYAATICKKNGARLHVLVRGKNMLINGLQMRLLEIQELTETQKELLEATDFLTAEAETRRLLTAI